MPSTPAMPPSLWAAVTPAGPKLSSLKGPVQADVLVIGAGFTGLSTALHLRRAGIDVAVVEAAEPGWGASGRNNGQVIPTLSRPDPDDIVRKYGAGGERLVALIRDCASILFDTVREERIEAEAEQTGWMQPVHSPGRMKIAERRVKQWSKHGAPVELLSRDEVRSMTGSDAWYGGFWNRSGGHVNPLALTRGLARSVLGRGGRIYANSPVISFQHDGAALGQQDGGRQRAIARAGARHQRLYRRVLLHAGTADRARGGAGAVLADGDAAAVRQRAPQHHPGPAGGVGHASRAVFRPLRRAPSPDHRRQPADAVQEARTHAGLRQRTHGTAVPADRPRHHRSYLERLRGHDARLLSAHAQARTGRHSPGLDATAAR